MGLVETHLVGRGATRDEWAKKAQSLHWRLLDNGARPTGNGGSAAGHARACEGGELFLARNYRHVHRFADKPRDLPSFCIPGGVGYDGFMAVTVHQQGYTFVLVVYYGYCSVGFGGDNVGRMARLRAFVRCLLLSCRPIFLELP